MATVRLRIGGRSYELACREGQQAEFERLAAIVDARATEAGRALGSTNESRQLLLAALLLADELTEDRQKRASTDEPTDGLAEALHVLAGRIERLADTLEKDAPVP